MDFHLDTLLNFPNVTVESCTQQSNEVYLKLRLLNEDASCPHCEQLILMRDLSIFGQATYLKVPRRQFYCHACQRYFTESLSFADEGRHYTRRYEEHVYRQVQFSSIEQVSRVEGLSFERIQGMFKHQYAEKKKTDGKVSNDLALMKSANAKDTRTLPRLSETLRLGD
jgi:transposase